MIKCSQLELNGAPLPAPIDMVLYCPACHVQHVDEADADEVRRLLVERGIAPWNNPPHRSHLCHSCGFIWRPADVPTNGVAAIKTQGKNDSPAGAQHAQPIINTAARELLDSMRVHEAAATEFCASLAGTLRGGKPSDMAVAAITTGWKQAMDEMHNRANVLARILRDAL